MPNAQFDAFQRACQSGQDMSLEQLFGVTLIFPGQGNSGGYAASAGAARLQLAPQADGTLINENHRAFRIRGGLLTGDGVVIESEKTRVQCEGLEWRVASVSPVGTDILRLICKQI